MFSGQSSQVSGGSSAFIEDVFATTLYTGNGSTQNVTTGVPLASAYGGRAEFVSASSQYFTVASNSNLNLTGNFTFELWIFSTLAAGSTTANNWFYIGPDITLEFANNVTGNGLVWYTPSSGALSFGTRAALVGAWQHVAVCRSGTTTRGFLNGVQSWSFTDSQAYNFSGASFATRFQGSPSAFWEGYASNFRIINGSALYTSNFTVPTSPLTVVGNTVLLINQSPNIFTDRSPLNLSITTFGSPISNSITGPFVASAASGLTWLKARSVGTDHALYDTARGATFDLASTQSSEQTTQVTGLTAFGGGGFSIGSLAKINTNGAAYTAWTFREQPSFFDIVTYTGNNLEGRQLSHNLGSVPGCVIIKRTDNLSDWSVYHRSLRGGVAPWLSVLYLNSTAAQAADGAWMFDADPTSTTLSLRGNTSVNANGGTYVAYLFAHDAGGFGATGADNAISCGSFTTNVSGTFTPVNLGYQPQWLLMKRADSSTAGEWLLMDNIRGLGIGANQFLYPNLFNAEATNTVGFVNLTSTGFQGASPTQQQANATYIYIAIRRGPMRTPTSGTSVFHPTVYTGTNVDNRLVNTTIAPDMVIVRQRNDAVLTGMVVGDRLRGQPYLLTGSTAGEVNDANAFDQQLVSAVEYGTTFSAMNGFWCGNDATAKLNANTASNNHVAETFCRAPGFFDVVCYTGTGTGSAQTVSHNLTVVPELCIIKARSAAVTNSWRVSAPQVFGSFNILCQLNTNGASGINSTEFGQAPTSTAIYPRDINESGQTYVAYLFASVTGVSKVGSYTGNGSTQTINCDFASGARFVLIKRTDSSGDWHIWDSARGIVEGNDPRLSPNTTAAEVTADDSVDAAATGFVVNQLAATNINVNAATYLYLAIA